MKRILISTATAALLAANLGADVTIRYKTEIEAAAPVPASDLGKGMSYSMSMKGAKGLMTGSGMTVIMDLDRQQVTLLDPVHHKYATIPVSEYNDKMVAALPHPDLKMEESTKNLLAGLKTKVESQKTGRTEAIQGVNAEEREITLSMEFPVPQGVKMPDMGMKMVMQIWSAQRGEALRVPAVRELSGFNLFQRYFMNPQDMFKKFGFPGMSDSFDSLFEEMTKDQSVVLRTHMAMYMPGMSALLAQSGQTATAAPNAPFMEMSHEVEELSTKPVEASLFDIPKDYEAAPFEDVLKGSMDSRLLH
jgi:hypothetical protein